VRRGKKWRSSSSKNKRGQIFLSGSNKIQSRKIHQGHVETKERGGTVGGNANFLEQSSRSSCHGTYQIVSSLKTGKVRHRGRSKPPLHPSRCTTAKKELRGPGRECGQLGQRRKRGWEAVGGTVDRNLEKRTLSTSAITGRGRVEMKKV